nr:nuclease domain-containing protein [Rhodothermus marinus]
MPGPPTDALNDLHRYRDALSSYFTRRGKGTVAQALALYPYRGGEAGCFAGTFWPAPLPKTASAPSPFSPAHRTPGALAAASACIVRKKSYTGRRPAGSGRRRRGRLHAAHR